MKTYVHSHMKQAFVDHVLEPAAGDNPDARAYRIVKSGTNIYSVYISEVANRLCITGDVCLGPTHYGIVSAAGYKISWFAGHLSESYLCEKFLRREWQWEAAVEEIEWEIQRDTEDADGWWFDSDKVKQWQEFVESPSWKYDSPNETEFYELMTEEFGCDGCELPGYDYPCVDAGWLCAIQQRYAELCGRK